MKTIPYVALIAALYVTPTFANSLYLGAELGHIRYGSETSGPVTEQLADDIDDGAMATLKVGSYFGPNLRVYGFLQRNGESEVSYRELSATGSQFTLSRDGYQYGVGSDYLFHLTPASYISVGGRVGYYYNTLDVSARASGQTLTSQIDTDGIAAGLSTSIGHHFTDHISLELGYRYEKLEKDDNVLLGQRITFEDTHQAFLGLNYTF
ncbi:hypothetical protein BZJ19_05815 [Salinivibrio proteolyticus]|uniref:outer membrane protein n=1 Tax=Salinivibrio proteolyticus TaxID=334715 RepID=UPI0009894A3B|nr:outer membrane beta-barrel protein [Salinivibrio proteolyticus]OOF26052.1 hypothetical protein BZJ19_05815 [Salinivibrio proteolyticus]